MKKVLLLISIFMLMCTSFSVAATTQTENVLNSLKNAVVQDVQNTVSSVATKAINKVKIVQYKAQLEQKKKELAELEASNTNFIVKFFKRIKLNREITKLENQIKELEAQ